MRKCGIFVFYMWPLNNFLFIIKTTRYKETRWIKDAFLTWCVSWPIILRRRTMVSRHVCYVKIIFKNDLNSWQMLLSECIICEFFLWFYIICKTPGSLNLWKFPDFFDEDQQAHSTWSFSIWNLIFLPIEFSLDDCQFLLITFFKKIYGRLLYL